MLSHSRKPKAQLDCTLSKLEKLSRARPVSTSLPPSTLVSPRRQRKSCPSDIFNTRLARLKCLESQFSILSSRTSWVSKKSPDFIFDPGAAQKVQDPKKIFCDLLFSDLNSTSDGSGKMPFPIKKLILSRFLPCSSLPR